MRQSSNNAKSTVFRGAFAELYNDIIDELTQRLLLGRCKQNLFVNKVASFNDVIQLYSTRAAVSKYNYNKIRDL